MGHRFLDCWKIADCQGACNNVTGCQSCLGSHRPLCEVDCEDGKYGLNCQNECGKCLTPPCVKTNGSCQGGCLMWSTGHKCDRAIDLPKRESETVHLVSTTNSTATLQWLSLSSVSLDLAEFYRYRIEYINVSDGVVNHGEFVTYQINYITSSVTGLKYNTMYTFTVNSYRMMNDEVEKGDSYEAVPGKTKCIAPQVPNPSIRSVNASNDQVGSIHVDWPNIADLDSGCDSFLTFEVWYQLADDQDTSIRESSDLSAHTEVIQPKVGGLYNIKVAVYNNERLREFTGTVSVTIYDPTPATPTSSRSGLIAALSVVVVVVLLGVGAVLGWFFWNRQKSRRNNYQGSGRNKSDDAGNNIIAMIENILPTKRESRSSEEENIYENCAIDVSHFEGYATRKLSKFDEIDSEYKSLPNVDLFRCEVAQRPENKAFNRFKNIYPYDDTRVVLTTASETETDYINGNYLTGFDHRRQYIATQGPKDNTIVEFWRMVWQEKANRIVMVANLEENGKNRCARYWPKMAGQSLAFDTFMVSTEAVQRSADYTVSTLTVQRGDARMTVRHCHFTTWEDKSKPVYGIATLLAFYKRVHSFDALSQGPMIVHCSAGVGRTGTFIVLDILMQQARRTRSLDVFGCVQTARGERMLMVQTKEQYAFIHDTLIEFINSKDVYLANRQQDSTPGRASEQPRLDSSVVTDEFKKLIKLNHYHVGIKEAGLVETNKNKNRDENIIPADMDRLYLPGGFENNYINAVYADSYAFHDAYIVTQMPLAHTIDDFWRLLFEYGSTTIIMLNNNNDGRHKQEAFTPYWPTPDQPTLVSGALTISLTETAQLSGNKILTRTFSIEKAKKTKKDPVITTRQFQLLTWPDDSHTPADGADLVQLSVAVKQWEERQKSADKIVVHSLDGADQVGVYLALCYMLEKMKHEQAIDPFTAARYVSRRRPEFFRNLEQYRFLYEAGHNYKAQDTSEYVNF